MAEERAQQARPAGEFLCSFAIVSVSGSLPTHVYRESLLGEETMNKLWIWTRNVLAVVGVLALGFWLGAYHLNSTSAPVVHASSYESDGMGVQFQFGGVNQGSSLFIYHPATKTVYVYQGAMVGNASVQCTYMFHMTRPGEVIHRVPCAIPQLNP